MIAAPHSWNPRITAAQPRRANSTVEGILATAVNTVELRGGVVGDISYRAPDRMAGSAAAIATPKMTESYVGLGPNATDDLLSGVELLTTTRFHDWSPSTKAQFLQANWGLLHEISHIALPDRSQKTLDQFAGLSVTSRAIEEGITDLATEVLFPVFMKAQYGIDLSESDMARQLAVAAYPTERGRLSNLLKLGTDGSTTQVGDAAIFLADRTQPNERAASLAHMIGKRVGGERAPAALVDELARVIPAFVSETGHRTSTSDLLGALEDHRAGYAVDIDAVVAAVRKRDPLSNRQAGANAGDEGA